MAQPTESPDLYANVDSIVVDLEGCARCWGRGHPGLEFEKLDHQVDSDDGAPMTHWAACPSNGQPILLGVAADGIG